MPDELNRCADFIQDYLKDCGIRYNRIESNGIPSISVVAENGYTPVLLMSHIDVVAADDELFEPYEKDGSLFGRGSADDKYAVAVSLVLLKKYMKKMETEGKGQESLPFGVLITGDEEIGGCNGAKQSLKDIKTGRFCSQ